VRKATGAGFRKYQLGETRLVHPAKSLRDRVVDHDAFMWSHIEVSVHRIPYKERLVALIHRHHLPRVPPEILTPYTGLQAVGGQPVTLSDFDVHGAPVARFSPVSVCWSSL
jgi:hypothetical protein